MRRKINIDGIEFSETLQLEIDGSLDAISEFAPNLSVMHLTIEVNPKYKFKFDVKMRLTGPNIMVMAETEGKNISSLLLEARKKMVKQIVAIKDKNIFNRRRTKSKQRDAA